MTPNIEIDKKSGFCFGVVKAITKAEEELDELKEAVALKDEQNIEEELGDIMFAMANVSRHLKKDPEITLHKACLKFEERFRLVEKSVAETGRDWNTFSLEELDTFWNEAKIHIKENKQ